MQTKLCLTLLIIVIPFISCKEESKSSREQTIKIQFEPKKSLIPHEIIANVTYVLLETTQESLIGNVDKMIIKDDRIYILDITLKAVYVFDLTGEFLFKIDRKGKGPGEYTDLLDFILDDNSIILNSYDKILYFDTDGNYKSTVKSDVKFNNLVFDNFDNAFLFQGNKISKHVLCTDKKFQKVNNEYFEPIRQEPIMFYRFQKLENKILLSAPQYLDNTIYELTPNQCLPYYEFDFGKYNLPTNIINNREINFNDEKVHEYAVINYIRENEKYIYCLFTHETYLYAGIRSKLTNKTYVGYNADSIPFFNVEIHELIGNKFYTAVPSYVYSKIKLSEIDDINGKKLKSIYTKSKNIQESTSINSNPVVVIYDMNF